MSATSITSAPTVLQGLTKLAYAASWSGTSPVGTLAVQGSGDYAIGANGVVSVAGTWTTMTLNLNGAAVSSLPVSGNTGSALIDMETAVYAIRLVYTKASGIGTLSATINGKVT